MSAPSPSARLPNVLLIGTGEYTTGLVNGQPSNSDKAAGTRTLLVPPSTSFPPHFPPSPPPTSTLTPSIVPPLLAAHTARILLFVVSLCTLNVAGIIALTIFDLRNRGLTGPRIGLCGTSGVKLPMIRAHLKKHIGDRYGLNTQCDTFPADTVERDTNAYQAALQTFERGDVAIVTTPDQTHFTIAKAAIERGLHVLIAKPVVQTLEDHDALIALSHKHQVLVAGELHKRWDPIYADASDRISSGTLGPLCYYYAYMSQPKSQLSTFSAWINDGSTDISYYLNSHHIDFLCNALTANRLNAKPVKVYAAASHGLADAYLTSNHPQQNGSQPYDVDDSITLTVTFVDTQSHNTGVAVFTSCWTAPLKPDSHTQQHQHFIGTVGEIHIDQAHRGYKTTMDATGVASPNPLFFKYTADRDGRFAGQSCYGYGSFEVFLRTASRVNAGEALEAMRRSVVSVDSKASLYNTAILEAGRKSMKEGRAVELVYGDGDSIQFK